MFERRRVAALLPALIVLAFAAELGTFHGGADGWRALLGHLILFVVLAWALSSLPRHTAIGLAAAWLAVAASVVSSPVPRAGLTALALLPAFLVLPWAFARLWRDEQARVWGVRAVLGVVAIVAAWSLLAWLRQATPGASLPLGHHNLLATWLVTLLPLASLWRGVGWLTAFSALGLGFAALLATGSLTGLIAAAVAASVVVGRRCRGQKSSVARRLLLAFGMALLAAVLILAVVGRGRILDLFGDRDISRLARSGYAEAAWQGIQERPLMGAGAGATRWTLAQYLRPRPGVHPPGEIVTDVHNLPLQWVYELGVLGSAVLVLSGWWLWRRRGGCQDEALSWAAGAGVVGWMVASLAGLDLGVTALPVALALSVGAFLASRISREKPRPAVVGRVPALLFVLLLGVWQWPRDLAHLHYDRAARASAEHQRQELAAALRYDPSMPLYRWRLATLEGDPAEALRAAQEAESVTALWLSAAEMAKQDGDFQVARLAYVRACDLDPLGAIAPFGLATLGGHPPSDGHEDDELSAERAARALIAEPSLLAAAWPPTVLETGVQMVLEIEGVDPGWRLALEHAARQVVAETSAGETVRLGLQADVVAAESMSLFAFRRRPWSTLLASVELRRDALGLVDLPAAAELDLTSREIFAPQCRLRRDLKGSAR